MEEYKDLIVRSIDVVKALQYWIEAHEGRGTFPTVVGKFSEWDLTIEIGGIEVFNLSGDYPGNLTFEMCRDRYIGELQDLQPFLQRGVPTDAGVKDLD